MADIGDRGSEGRESVSTVMSEWKRRLSGDEDPKVVDIQERMQGRFEYLAVPGRRFILSSGLTKVSNKTTQDRTFFLFSDIVVYAKEKKNKNYNFKGRIDLDTAWINVPPPDRHPELPNIFQIVCPDKTYSLQAADEVMRAEWVTSLNEQIDAMVEDDASLINRRGIAEELKQGWRFDKSRFKFRKVSTSSQDFDEVTRVRSKSQRFDDDLRKSADLELPPITDNVLEDIADVMSIPSRGSLNVSMADVSGTGASGGGGVGGSGSGSGGALVTAGGPIDPAVEALAGRRGNTKRPASIHGPSPLGETSSSARTSGTLNDTIVMTERTMTFTTVGDDDDGWGDAETGDGRFEETGGEAAADGGSDEASATPALETDAVAETTTGSAPEGGATEAEDASPPAAAEEQPVEESRDMGRSTLDGVEDDPMAQGMRDTYVAFIVVVENLRKVVVCTRDEAGGLKTFISEAASFRDVLLRANSQMEVVLDIIDAALGNGGRSASSSVSESEDGCSRETSARSSRAGSVVAGPGGATAGLTPERKRELEASYAAFALAHKACLDAGKQIIISKKLTVLQGAASEGWESLESALDDMEAAMVACLPEEAFDLASRIDGARLIAAAQREAAEAAEWE